MAANRVRFTSIITFALGCALMILSCSETPNQAVMQDARRIAKMKCASQKLTEEKFVLAGRYAEIDQLIVDKKITSDSFAKIKNHLDQQKALLIQESQDSSDKLLLFLKNIWQEKYTTEAERSTLDSLTEVELRKICKTP